MTRSLWLHCGSFKAGSSRIQQEIWGRRAELLDSGWLYPDTGLVTDEPEVGFRHADFVYGRYDAARFALLVADLGDEIAASSCRHVVMSSEAWTRPGAGEALAQLVGTLRDRGLVDEVHGVLYLRNRLDYARSFYRELTRRRGNTRPFPAFIEASRRPLDPLDTVRTLQAALAPGTLHVFRYEEIGDTAVHLLSLLGLAADPAAAPANPGITAVEAEAVRQVNLLAADLTPAWPGVAAATPRFVRLDLPEVEEQPGPGQLAADPAYHRELERATGWQPEQVAALLRLPDARSPDVATLAPTLRGVVLHWLSEAARPALDVTIWDQPGVDLLELADLDAADEVRLSGRLLLPPDTPDGWRLWVVGDQEREARTGRDSPALARRLPGRADAAHARFVAGGVGVAAGGRVDLVLEDASGGRRILATVRRRWTARGLGLPSVVRVGEDEAHSPAPAPDAAT